MLTIIRADVVSVSKLCAGARQHAQVELALMQAVTSMAQDGAALPYVNRVLDQLCPPGEPGWLTFFCLSQPC